MRFAPFAVAVLLFPVAGAAHAQRGFAPPPTGGFASPVPSGGFASPVPRNGYASPVPGLPPDYAQPRLVRPPYPVRSPYGGIPYGGRGYRERGELPRYHPYPRPY